MTSLGLVLTTIALILRDDAYPVHILPSAVFELHTRSHSSEALKFAPEESRRNQNDTGGQSLHLLAAVINANRTMMQLEHSHSSHVQTSSTPDISPLRNPNNYQPRNDRQIPRSQDHVLNSCPYKRVREHQKLHSHITTVEPGELKSLPSCTRVQSQRGQGQALIES